MTTTNVCAINKIILNNYYSKFYIRSFIKNNTKLCILDTHQNFLLIPSTTIANRLQTFKPGMSGFFSYFMYSQANTLQFKYVLIHKQTVFPSDYSFLKSFVQNITSFTRIHAGAPKLYVPIMKHFFWTSGYSHRLITTIPTHFIPSTQLLNKYSFFGRLNCVYFAENLSNFAYFRFGTQQHWLRPFYKIRKLITNQKLYCVFPALKFIVTLVTTLEKHASAAGYLLLKRKNWNLMRYINKLKQKRLAKSNVVLEIEGRTGLVDTVSPQIIE